MYFNVCTPLSVDGWCPCYGDSVRLQTQLASNAFSYSLVGHRSSGCWAAAGCTDVFQKARSHRDGHCCRAPVPDWPSWFRCWGAMNECPDHAKIFPVCSGTPGSRRQVVGHGCWSPPSCKRHAGILPCSGEMKRQAGREERPRISEYPPQMTAGAHLMHGTCEEFQIN